MDREPGSWKTEDKGGSTSIATRMMRTWKLEMLRIVAAGDSLRLVRERYASTAVSADICLPLSQANFGIWFPTHIISFTPTVYRVPSAPDTSGFILSPFKHGNGNVSRLETTAGVRNFTVSMDRYPAVVRAFSRVCTMATKDERRPLYAGNGNVVRLAGRASLCRKTNSASETSTNTVYGKRLDSGVAYVTRNEIFSGVGVKIPCREVFLAEKFTEGGKLER